MTPKLQIDPKPVIVTTHPVLTQVPINNQNPLISTIHVK